MYQNEETVTLLVEDDPGHAWLIEKNLRRSQITSQIVRVENGDQALDFLLGKTAAGRRAASARVLILLDLNMPGLSGHQVLAQLKANERTRHIPVILLTTTEDPAEIQKCRELGCSLYITKPVDYEQFSEAMRRLGLFLAIVKTPEENPALTGLS